jgi:hypothetical protein
VRPCRMALFSMHEKFMAGRPWLALVALGALFELPAVLLPEPLRPTAELIVLFVVWLCSLWLPRAFGRPLRFALALGAFFLTFARIDRIAFREMMGEEPLLYDQLFLVRHLFVLIDDVWSVQVGLALLGIALVVGALVWLVRWLLRHVAVFAEPTRSRSAGGIALFAAIALSSTWIDKAPHVVNWMTPALLKNVDESRGIYRQVQSAIRKSAYRSYASLHVTGGPDVYLVFVESYGRVIASHPDLRERYLAQMTRMQQTLGAAGWSMASAFSKAPVMGGRSWLAEGSLIMGMHVGYEALFRQVVDQIDRVPNLVSFLKRQGYRTVMLAPADRVRPGVEAVNYYHYDQTIGFDDLHYHGPPTGWGLVPDQYSLGYVDEHVLAQTPHPFYFEFHMVSSHTPWKEAPVLVDDWRELGKAAAPVEAHEDDGALLKRLRRYVHTERRFARLGKMDATMASAYADAVLYELALLERHLAGMRNNALVIVIGDHQPPFLAAETRSFDTPLHIFARDPRLLDEFYRYGFRNGLTMPLKQQRATRHEGIFSLVVRALMHCCSKDPPPTFLWAGAPLDTQKP